MSVAFLHELGAEKSLNSMVSILMWPNVTYHLIEIKEPYEGCTIRRSPFEEAKLVRCTMGAIFDVIIDLRPNSKTFMQWIAIELTAENRKMIYIPEGFAHGFLTLEDDTEVFYQMSEFYSPGYDARRALE